MNKKLIGIIVAVILISGGGYYFYSQQSDKTSLDAPKEEQTTLSSIKDALSRSVSMECEYTDESGVVTKTYIKNGAIRVDGSGSDEVEPGGTIIKENKMYVWSDDTKEGYVFETSETEENGEDIDLTGTSDKGEFIEAIEQYKDYCKVTTVSDALFNPPSDIKFSDMSEMFKDFSGYTE